ncbi:MAG: hypothetical protein KBD00_01580 [Candidatus Peribacteraceae bacterium]|nr:hypothetical protein [Candidatus Peribacteraceae bacterium]
MTTIVERDTNTSSSAMTMIVAIIAIAAIIGIALYALNMFPGLMRTTPGSDNNPINVDVNTPAPTNPAVQ